MGIFRRRSDPGVGVPATGHPGDDQLLAQIAARSNLEAGRHWVHYLYFAEEDGARAAAAQIAESGWGIQRVDVAANGGPEWVVIAEKHGADQPASCE